MTMNGSPCEVSPKSKTRTIAGCMRRAAARASVSSRPSAPAVVRSRRMSLMATSMSSGMLCACQTAPMPPRPMMRVSRYFSSMTSPARYGLRGAAWPGRRRERRPASTRRRRALGRRLGRLAMGRVAADRSRSRPRPAALRVGAEAPRVGHGPLLRLRDRDPRSRARSPADWRAGEERACGSEARGAAAGRNGTPATPRGRPSGAARISVEGGAAPGDERPPHGPQARARGGAGGEARAPLGVPRGARPAAARARSRARASSSPTRRAPSSGAGSGTRGRRSRCASSRGRRTAAARSTRPALGALALAAAGEARRALRRRDHRVPALQRRGRPRARAGPRPLRRRRGAPARHRGLGAAPRGRGRRAARAARGAAACDRSACG